MTWTSTICVVIMATYGRTLCWKEKKHGPEHRWGVCCRGNIADHGHYRREAITGYAPRCGRSVLRAIRCASRRAGCSLVVLVRCFSVQDAGAGSYTWPERVLLLDSVTTVVLIGNSRSTSSRGGVVSAFRERFSCICDRWGLYRFYRAWKILSCGVLRLLEVSVSTVLCHGSL